MFVRFLGSDYPILKLFFFMYALVILGLAYSIQPMHDYAAYLIHWNLVVVGGDPWQKMESANAYGPIYNIFAWLYIYDKQLPKLVFVGSWLVIAIYSTSQFWKLPQPSSVQKWLFLLFWFANPFFIVNTIFYGFNDNFVALLVFVALILIVFHHRHSLGVLFITFGVLTKLYPLFLLPFLSANKQNILRYALLFVLGLTIAYTLTYWVWGGSFVNPFGKANGRDPALFSIMRFVDGAYFPFKTLGNLIVALSNLFILLGIGYVFKQYKNSRIDQISAFLAGFTILLLFYKAGQQQFYLTYFAIFGVWCMFEFQKSKPNIRVYYWILLLALWLAVMAGLVYPLTNQMEGEYAWLRDLIGLPTFLILWMIGYHLIKQNIALSEGVIVERLGTKLGRE